MVEIFINVEVCIIIHCVIMVYQHSLMTPATGCSCSHIIGLKWCAVNELPLGEILNISQVQWENVNWMNLCKAISSRCSDVIGK